MSELSFTANFIYSSQRYPANIWKLSGYVGISSKQSFITLDSW